MHSPPMIPPLLLRALGALALLLAGPAAAAPQAEPAAAGPAPDAYVIRIEGSLNAGHQALFQRAARRAKADDAMLVMVFNTPGGEITRMRQFAASVDAEVEAGLAVVGWVDDSALSAGTWIAIATRSLYMRTRATMGAATAIQITPKGVVAAEEKFASSYRAWVRAWAEEHGKDPLLAQAMIDFETAVIRVKIDGVEELISGQQWNDLNARGEAPERISTVVSSSQLLTVTGAEAIEYGFADALAETVDEVLAKEGMSGATWEELDFSRSEEWLSKLWDMRLLFLFLGLFFGYVELKVPGFGVPGILSLASFGIMFAGQYLIGVADVPHIALAAVGVVLVAVELFLFPGMLWPGILGALCLIAGLLMTQVGQDVSLSNAWDRRILFDSSFELAATAAAALIGIWAISRYLPDTPILRRMVLQGGGGAVAAADAMPESRSSERLQAARVGARGRAVTSLRPVGKVDLEGDGAGLDYEARAESGLIEAGTAIEVVEVSAGRLLVRPAQGGSDAPTSS